MKVTLDIPDGIVCGFFNGVEITSEGMSLVSYQLGSDDLTDGKTRNCPGRRRSEMIYNYCNHTEGKCPCLTCAERDCPSCDGTGPGKYGVDTDRLCARAKAYCESGRSEFGDRKRPESEAQ